MIIDSLIEDFAGFEPYDYLPKDYNIWYVGRENSIDKGINNLLVNLSEHGHILIDELEIVNYKYDDILIDIILYRSLPKLEYLEYKAKEREDKNVLLD
jgi:hypothetical protein